MTSTTVSVGQPTKSAGLGRYLPIVGWLPAYRRDRFAPDAVAALSVWALLIPQSLGDATIAGVPVQYGLYAAFTGLVAYAIFGTSRQVVQGPSGAVAAVSAAVVGPIVGTSALGTDKAVGYTAALALMAGAVYLALGVLRMGWVSREPESLELWTGAGAIDAVGRDHVFATVRQAVAAFDGSGPEPAYTAEE
jgi:sulfate permease, SulP family